MYSEINGCYFTFGADKSRHAPLMWRLDDERWRTTYELSALLLLLSHNGKADQPMPFRLFCFKTSTLMMSSVLLERSTFILPPFFWSCFHLKFRGKSTFLQDCRNGQPAPCNWPSSVCVGRENEMVLFNFSSRVPAIRNESLGDTPLHQLS